jgi:hypothetical protein
VQGRGSVYKAGDAVKAVKEVKVAKELTAVKEVKAVKVLKALMEVKEVTDERLHCDMFNASLVTHPQIKAMDGNTTNMDTTTNMIKDPGVGRRGREHSGSSGGQSPADASRR